MSLRRLLLVSSSATAGTGYLDHCENEIQDLLGEAIGRVLFVPYALHDRAGYARVARERLGRMGYEVDSLHDSEDPRASVRQTEAIFVGGGNTFRLLNELYRKRLMDVLVERAESGVPYIGTSAGTNVACVSIKTTNDMPIVYPPSLDGLGLVPFNINPHYFDPDPNSDHQGETRETRIREFHEENDPPVVGLREGSMLRVDGEQLRLLGTKGARLFRRGEKAVELESGAKLDFLLKE